MHACMRPQDAHLLRTEGRQPPNPAAKSQRLNRHSAPHEREATDMLIVPQRRMCVAVSVLHRAANIDAMNATLELIATFMCMPMLMPMPQMLRLPTPMPMPAPMPMPVPVPVVAAAAAAVRHSLEIVGT